MGTGLPAPAPLGGTRMRFGGAGRWGVVAMGRGLRRTISSLGRGVDLVVVVVVVVDQVGPGDGKCSARSAFMMPMSGEACNAVS